MTKKVKESLSLMVKIPGELIETPVTITYDDIWTPYERTWRFQTWIEHARRCVNVQGRLNKDGLMSRKNICVSVCRVPKTFYNAPQLCTPIRSRIVDYK